MNQKDFEKFKINIKYKNDTPIKPKNQYILYEQDFNRTQETLSTKIYFENRLIAIGVILDFYKTFETRKSEYGNDYTFPLDRTELGKKIFEIKFYKNPPISIYLKEQYMQSFVELFKKPLETIQNHVTGEKQNLYISYIPSSTKTPNILASKLSEKFNIQLEKLIFKDNNLEESKSIENFYESMKHSQKKYKFNTEFIEKNNKSRYLVVDDVFGLGSSILTTMKTIYDINKNVNFFFCVVKDVKR